MLVISRHTYGHLYVLCFSRPLGNLSKARGKASHYLGWSLCPERRIAKHLKGQSGVPVVEAALAAGITMTPYILGPAPKSAEWYLKNHTKRIAPYCPGCHATPRPLPARAFQLELELDAPEEFPEPPALRADWLELEILKEFRHDRATMQPAIDLSTFDAL